MALANLLVFSRTEGYRHESIPESIAILSRILPEIGISADFTENVESFRATTLARYHGVLWLQTTGNVLDPDGRAAYAEFVRKGGATIGIHAATVAEPDWPFFRELFGARFVGHPPGVQTGQVEVQSPHPSVAMFPSSFSWSEEWYEFDGHPAADFRVLATVDESSYLGAQMGNPHPIVWCRSGPYRVWYSAFGHEATAFEDSLMQSHFLSGVMWALGLIV
jgi:type 1 glutamine amidotransferase